MILPKDNIKVIGFTDSQDLATQLEKHLNDMGLKPVPKEQRIKRNKFILQVGIESDLDLMDLKKLITQSLKPHNDNGTFKGMTWGSLIEYEKIEFCVTHVEGTNNGSGCNFWIEKGNPNSD